jgi:hypothetical protein
VTTQRIDINTSGLLVVATYIPFAAYFAELLRHKTKQSQETKNETANTTASNNILILRKATSVWCACMQQPSSTTDPSQEDDSSVVDLWLRLKALQERNTTICHYLEPSNRAPKRFAETRLEDDWLKCLLQITNDGEIHPIPSLHPTIHRRPRCGPRRTFHPRPARLCVCAK